MSAVRLCFVVLLSAAGGLAGGCAKPGPPNHGLVVGSDLEAVALVDRFLRAYEAGHADAAASFLCEQDAESQARARELISSSQQVGSPYRITKHEVTKVEPKWAGSVPSFYVEVEYPRTTGDGVVVHGYQVRAAQGCIEGLYGRPPPPPAPGPAAPTAAAPPPAADAGAVPTVDAIDL